MSAENRDLVVILHGIGMSALRMAYMEWSLRRAGFRTLNVNYPSLHMGIEDCASYVVDEVTRRISDTPSKIHIVAHSMGCLVALHLLAQNRLPAAARAVFIAPPYRGSEVADLLHKFALYRRLFGPAGSELTTGYRKDKTFLLPSNVEIGVVAGTRGYEYPFFLHVMNRTGAHDGLVSLKSTRIPDAKDHITIRMSHSFLLEKSASQAVHFLMQGRFIRKSE